MRIGFLIDDSFDYPDGVQQYVRTVGSWLNKKGHDVQYIASTSKKTNDFNVVSLTKHINVSFNGNTLRTPLPISLRKATRFSKSHPLDVLHVQMPYSPFFAGKLIRAYSSQKTKIVGTFHIVPYSPLNTISARMQRFSTAQTLSMFDEVCSVSKPAQNFANNYFKIKSSVIPNAVDVKSFKRKKTPTQSQGNAITITFLGRLVERKGCYYLIQAIFEVVKQCPELKDSLIVRIGGRGKLESSLRRQVAELHLSHIILFDGFIDGDKADYLSSGDICVFPSIGGESFGIVVVEALSTNACIVLAGDNVGYRTVMSDLQPQLFNPKDIAEFADKLITFIKAAKNTSMTKEIINKQSKTAEKYSVDTVGPKLLKLYGAI